MKELLDKSPMKPVVFEQEFFPEDVLVNENLPFTVERSEEDPEVFLVEGPKIEKMLGYTNLDSEKGFAFFQKFLKEGGYPGGTGKSRYPGRRYGSYVWL